MSVIPGNLSRVPNLLVSQQALSSLTRTNLGLFKVQNDLSTGRIINRFSDDAVKAAGISILDDRLERSEQIKRNLDHADSSLSVLDQSLGDINELILTAKSIASEQVGFGHSAEERASQGIVIDSLLQSLFGISNRQSVAGHVFGGSTPGTSPMAQLLGGYQYRGQGTGLLTELGLGSDVPITLGADTAFGAVSSRVQGSVDLNPAITGDTRLVDIQGARGLGVTLGVVEFSVSGGPRVQVDLAGSDSVDDVLSKVTAAIRDYEQTNSVTILGAGGVSYSGGALTIDVATGVPNPTIEFFDLTSGVTGQDLGLVGSPAIVFSAGSANGADINPELTWRSPISALAGVTGALGSIRINNLGQSRIIDLSSAQTLGDIRNLVQGAGLGIRVEVNAAGTGINFLNEAAAGSTQAMSIEEVPGSNLTATRLGIRSFSDNTLIADLNNGRGVRIANGNVDPVTGLPDPTRDVDFTIRLGNTPTTEFNVDLRPEDMVNIGTIAARINQQAAAAGVAVPADFNAGLSDGANGLTLTQNASFGTAILVTAKNQSQAADDLGLIDGTYNAGTSSWQGTDRAKVRVNNLFSTLIDLRESLRDDDTAGISLAGEELESHIDRLATTRALVGGYAKRVEDGVKRREDQELLDLSTRSQLQDTDFTEAAVRLNLLQTQLQAGLTVTAQSLQRSLLDFIG
jgi:flagellar hook-associated protein 3 FlgL